MHLEFESYWELLALHKTIMAAKFDPNPWLPEAQGSPFTASLALKVFDLLIDWCKSEGKTKEANEWLNWQIADETRREVELLKKRIQEADWWLEASAEKRKKYTLDFMAPLKLEPELFKSILVGY